MSIESEYGGCRSRRCLEGWIGRRRTYRCQRCKGKFQVDTLNSIPKKERLCPECKSSIRVAISVANAQGNWDSFKGGDAKKT